MFGGDKWDAEFWKGEKKWVNLALIGGILASCLLYKAHVNRCNVVGLGFLTTLILYMLSVEFRARQAMRRHQPPPGGMGEETVVRMLLSGLAGFSLAALFCLAGMVVWEKWVILALLICIAFHTVWRISGMFDGGHHI